MTMKYAEFHPSYSDLAPHFDQMGEMLGLASAGTETADLGDSLGDIHSSDTLPRHDSRGVKGLQHNNLEGWQSGLMHRS